MESLKQLPNIESLDELIAELRKVFDSDRVNVEYVHSLMASYKSRPRDWKKYANFDTHRYTRNLVDEGNGKYNLMILAWSEGHGSSIHDHSDSHCFMKMLYGSLTEIRYSWPKESDEVMVPSEEIEIKTNEVAYINDSIGLHRVENRSHAKEAVSLHLYCPPYDTCHMFDQRTGHKMPCKVTFWTKFGEKTPHILASKGEVTHYEDN